MASLEPWNPWMLEAISSKQLRAHGLWLTTYFLNPVYILRTKEMIIEYAPIYNI